MAEKNLSISPNITLSNTQDYEYLRKLGLEYIEKLGSDLWTDYNSHDPGITTLEVLSYALTELGFRMQLPIQDLLTNRQGTPELENTFFTPRQILTTHPVTTLDYRKLLVDVEGVANAWLSKVTDHKPDVFADCKLKKLDYEQTGHQLNIRGIWDVLLELEHSDEFGNTNAPGFEYEIEKGSLKGKTIEFAVHERADVSWKEWFKGDCLKVEILNWKKETNTQWTCKLKYKFKEDGSITFKSLDFTLIGRDLGEGSPDTALKNTVKSLAEESLQQAYLARERFVLSILERVEYVLASNRNLCEDFRKMTLVSSEEISFCADIETAPEADLEEIEAKIILGIQNYLSPEVSFYNLLEMQKAGFTSDEIFIGPKLKHGFIKNEEIQSSELRTAVYSSDVINILMDIEGVKSVSNFVMSRFSSTGKLIKKGEQWELNITKDHKPRYARSKSKWLFFKNKIPFVTRKSEVDDIIDLLKAESANNKLLKTVTDILPQKGKYRELNQYFSIQNDFPLAYATSEEGFPASATKERINQAKQFQGYLQFFDQILADLLAQAEHFKSFVSLDKTVDRTYYNRFLEEIPGREYIYKSATELEAKLPELAEDRDTFFRRRNKALDHLLSRFQESFNNHVLLLYTTSGERIAKSELLEDKINFLNRYPETSSRRFTGVNLMEAGSWPYSASSGLMQRVLLLSGIQNSSLHFLMPVRLELVPQGPAAEDKWKVVWKKRGTNTKLFTSAQAIVGKDSAKRMGRKGFQRFIEGSFETKKAGSKFRIVFGKDDYEFRGTELFASAESAKTAALALHESLNKEAEGMNLIEHLLLRPFDSSYTLMNACIPDDCKFCGEEDPYSFKFSIVLPYWPTKFRRMTFRRLIEELVHKEAPAHLLPKVCWADPFAWQELEDAYFAWLGARPKPDATEKRITTARLIMALENVETVYPEAVLHDCEDDRDENPVILNQTQLGIF